MSLEIVDEIFHINNDNICGKYVFGIIEHNKSFKGLFDNFKNCLRKSMANTALLCIVEEDSLL